MFGDPVHLEQALINHIENALEASGSDCSPAKTSCEWKKKSIEFVVLDSGIGISNSANLLVPLL